MYIRFGESGTNTCGESGESTGKLTFGLVNPVQTLPVSLVNPVQPLVVNPVAAAVSTPVYCF